MRWAIVKLTASLLLLAGVVGVEAASALPPSGTLVGDSTREPAHDVNNAGQAQAFPFAAVASGSSWAMKIYVDSPSTATTVTMGVYSDLGGRPGSLLTSASTNRLTVGAWNLLALPSASLTQGKTYWLAVLGTGGQSAFLDNHGGSCSSSGSAETTLTSLPTKWTDGSRLQSCQLSAYVTGALQAPPPSPPSATAPPQVSGSTTVGPSSTNCISNLAACGYPDAGGNDGVPSGTALTHYSGGTITTPGTVINGVLCSPNCVIDIEASNVTIQNSRLIGSGGQDHVVLIGQTNNATTGVQLSNDEIAGSSPTAGGTINQAVVNRGSANLTLQNDYLHACAQCITEQARNPGTLNVTGTYAITDSCVGPSPHYEPYYNGSPHGIRFSNDTLLNPINQTAAYLVDSNHGGSITGGQTLSGNFIAGGGYTLYFGGGSGPTTITNNRFSSYFWAGAGEDQSACSSGSWSGKTTNKSPGYFGVVYPGTLPSNANWSGNYWDDNLAHVPAL